MGLSTHILDTARGRPAADVALTLSQLRGSDWHELSHARTDTDGRANSLLVDRPLEAATYKIFFNTGEYFCNQHVDGLYPYVEIVFTVADPTQHYHIPLLLTANGYTNYRGS